MRGQGGAVSSGDARATRVGIEILRTGGNAVDAAVATALALAVVYPEAGNLGGGGFAVIKRGDRLSTLDFREVAPAAGKRDMYLDSEGEPVEDASRVGALAAGVPGSPAGLWELHRKHGRLPWKVISGVVKDFKTNSLRENVKPLLIGQLSNYYTLTSVKMRSSNISQTQQAIQSL